MAAARASHRSVLRLIQPGELGAGPCEVVGVGAEEAQVLGEAEDAAVELVL
ncbi:hypothetical protein ACIHJG_37250 [Streptomyces sp. NPDC052415]|uniref:hypothetical protein n=1 Tax=Streptomyces sp. NPDC052415 TaxID=3365690 RepID=UPI0037D02C0F